MVDLERGAEACTSFSTGMGGISNTLLTLLEPGDRCVSIADIGQALETSHGDRRESPRRIGRL